MYYTENSHHSLDLSFSEAKAFSYFFSWEDDFASLRAGILQVNSKEIRLRNENLKNDLSPFSESAFSAEKQAILCPGSLKEQLWKMPGSF